MNYMYIYISHTAKDIDLDLVWVTAGWYTWFNDADSNRQWILPGEFPNLGSTSDLAMTWRCLKCRQEPSQEKTNVRQRDIEQSKIPYIYIILIPHNTRMLRGAGIFTYETGHSLAECW